MRVQDEGIASANLYCLHARTSKNFWEIFKPSEFELGDTFVLLEDGTEFLRRLVAAASTQGRVLRIGLVKYVDKTTYVGPMGPFRKFSEYAADQELRALARPGLGKPLTLRLGDLSDIALLHAGDRRLRMDPRPSLTGEVLAKPESPG
jgi:hypothetical protein